MAGQNLNSNKECRGNELMKLVHWQLGFGRRFPGSHAHELFRSALATHVRDRVDSLTIQPFNITLRSRTVECANIIGKISPHSYYSSTSRGPILIGAHFDTRIIADRDDKLKSFPIPGANDGGSGTAVLLHLLDRLAGIDIDRDIFVVLFDAEDVGNIEGNPFSMGARFLAAHPQPVLPGEVLILDMVGGKDMVLNIDTHILHYPGSRRLTEEMWRLALKTGFAPLTRDKENKFKYIVSDHTPFQSLGIPSCILIDIDYPEWHTQADLPEAMSGKSMAMVEELVLTWLSEKC
ncbi:MAG: M28 family peptidase [Gammaproteobacteria bacterium]|nr:M28 family peptidase [Gammaproteobacteria bacterium]